jgi:hypothetical protein
MKTYLTYGGAMAIGGALLTFALYFLGLHSDPAKLGAAQGVGFCGAVVIGFACLILGVKARREEMPAEEDFGYGRALGAGVMVVLFSSLFGMITSILYSTVINPSFADVIVQAQVQQWEAAGLTGTQVESAEKVTRSLMKPPIQAVLGFFGGMVSGTVMSLITAAFLKRSALDPAEDQPPALG